MSLRSNLHEALAGLVDGSRCTATPRVRVNRIARADSPPVVGHGFERRGLGLEPGEVVEARIANVGIEAAFAAALGINVPDAEALFANDVEALWVRQHAQVDAPEGRQHGPEVVAWVRVVLAGRERRDAWEAAQHEQARVGRNDRSQPGEWG